MAASAAALSGAGLAALIALLLNPQSREILKMPPGAAHFER